MAERKHLILGTAGHVDHGKTELVRALTGQETDRLAAEKERGISIELGFAHYEIDGRRFGVVDVPGHERFLRQMLAGAHGIDLVLFVIAADDGIMPQTEEHFDILHLLGVQHGIFVLTKIDLVEGGRIDVVRSDVEVLAAGTNAETWPVCAVSSTTGRGLEELRAWIRESVDDLPPRSPGGWFRLPIDRAFHLHGHGLVVTGTAVAGSVREGDELALRPGGRTTRARQVQVHGETVREAFVGQRVAVNLPGVEQDEARRGHWLVDPRIERLSDRFDCRVEIRPGARRPLASFDRVRLHVSTAEVMGRVIVLGEGSEIAPKSTAWCQIALDEPVLVAAGDRFILRTETATRTTGGGQVVHPFAPRHRPGEEHLEEKLETLRDGTLPERIAAFLDLLREFAAPTELVAQALARTSPEILGAAAQSPRVVALPHASAPLAWTTCDKWTELESAVTDALAAFHRAHPLEAGMDLESLRSRLRVPLPPKQFRPAIDRLAVAGSVVRDESRVRLPQHRVSLDDGESTEITRITGLLASGGLTPLDAKVLATTVGLAPDRLTALLRVLEQRGSVVRVSSDLFYDAAAHQEARRLLLAHFRDHREITVADYRTLLSASRKYALALLEHFDATGVTVRIGDARRLRSTGG
ncbi:MAG: selenocysteine-specific translation elongation factor [Deltaproteobacteria bacterium]|nr:selenocysteine-specific translation elongation factor [Deltaproteobacteria bacterium]